MIEPSALLGCLEDRGYDALVHVADSVLAGVLAALDGHPRLDCFGANNEGEALAIAAGISLAGGRPAVLLQNSGIGNLLNPLVSLTDPARLPVLLIVGWRGRPGHPDEPQHARMGTVTREL
ncbi:MAG: phosphonopyruvate decarboxylase, partial [Actinobacteria bacterium]|nr:phosphonopyruvate decarboxylase [Actinomycetota bacterium]